MTLLLTGVLLVRRCRSSASITGVDHRLVTGTAVVDVRLGPCRCEA